PNARNSPHGLCRQAIAGMRIRCAALAPMAISAAAPAFQYAAPARAQLCALDSGLRCRTSRHVADLDRRRDVGTRSAYRFAELACTSRVGGWDRDVPPDGLRLLVVALG